MKQQNALVGSLCGYAIKVVTAFDLEVISSKLAWDFTIHQIVPTQIISKRNFGKNVSHFNSTIYLKYDVL